MDQEPTSQSFGAGLIEAQQRLRRMVLDALPSPNSRRNYAKALDLTCSPSPPAGLSPGLC